MFWRKGLKTTISGSRGSPVTNSLRMDRSRCCPFQCLHQPYHQGAAQLIKTSGIGTHSLAKKTPGPIKALTIYSKCLIRCQCFARGCGHHFFTNSSPRQCTIIAHQPLPWRWLAFSSSSTKLSTTFAEHRTSVYLRLVRAGRCKI